MNRILVIGTGNKHKVQEIAPLLAGLPVILRAAGEYGLFHPEENGNTAEENAHPQGPQRAGIERRMGACGRHRPGHPSFGRQARHSRRPLRRPPLRL